MSTDAALHEITADEKFIPVRWAEPEFARIEQSEGRSALFISERDGALAAVSIRGIPTTRVEEWRYTNAQPVAKEPRVIGGAAAADPKLRAALSIAETTLVLVNGKYLPDATRLPDGVEAAALSTAASDPAHPLAAVVREHLGKIAPFENDQIVALNTALVRDGIVIRLKKGADVKGAIELLFLTAADSRTASAAVFPRVLIVAEPFSKAEIIEIYSGSAGQDYLTSAVTEISIGDEASLTHTKVQLESLNATHFSRVQVRQGRASRFSSRVFNFGGGTVRNEINPLLGGEGIDTTLFGLTVITGNQHVDNHTTLDHAKPNSQSTEIYKGIYGGKSRGVFCGTIIVRQDAQKTNAIQSNNSVLLSSDAEIDSKPQLKIYADDVKCTHGATVGQLDDQALFYLRSRGIDEKTARGMLVRAFAEDVVSRIEHPKLNALLEEKLAEKLDNAL